MAEKVLIVEDNPGWLIAIKMLIIHDLKVPENNIETATNGIEAEEIIKQKEIYLVVSDITMPGKSGLQLLKAVRANSDSEIANLNFIIMTSHSDKEYKQTALAEKATAYFRKDEDKEKIIKTIEPFLSPKSCC